jgi:Fur family transcriptional regulator, ferric uptake regulator
MILDRDITVSLFRNKGIHITEPRIAIIRILIHADTMLCLSEILDRLHYRYGRVTVYRVLRTFCQKGLVIKLVDLQNSTYYRFNDETGSRPMVNKTDKVTFFFKCIGCGKTTVIIKKNKSYTLPDGFVQTDTNLLINGYCDTCVAERKPEFH